MPEHEHEDEGQVWVKAKRRRKRSPRRKGATAKSGTNPVAGEPPTASSPSSRAGCSRSATSARPARCWAGTRRPTCRRAAPPRAGGRSRRLSRLAHEKLTDPAIGRLLDELAAYADSLPRDSDDAEPDPRRAARLRAGGQGAGRVRRPLERAWLGLLRGLDARAARQRLRRDAALAREDARPQPPVRRLLPALRAHRRSADRRRRRGHDAATVRALFAELRAQLVPIVRAIAAQPPADDSCLRSSLPRSAAAGLRPRRRRRFGYDFERGRQDKTHHPFCTKFASGDVRITTRVRENDLGEALFATLHEAGHALYEQGIDAGLEGTPLGRGHRPASTRASRGCGRTWSGAAAASGSTSIRALRQAFPGQLARCRWRPSTAPSTRSSAR